jgi:hypothetical protein
MNGKGMERLGMGNSLNYLIDKNEVITFEKLKKFNNKIHFV